MTGHNFWLVVGPAVFAIAVLVWIGLVVLAARRRRKYGAARNVADRGPVTGGRIEGGPSQVSRRDEVPRRG